MPPRYSTTRGTTGHKSDWLFVKRREQALLAELTPRERQISEEVMADHPNATLARIIAGLKAGGM